MVRTRERPSDRPRLRPGRTGYRLGNREFDGFPDQPELEDRQRARIADWGRAAGWPLSPEQNALLERSEPAPPSNAQRQTAEDERWIATSVPQGLLSLLSDGQARFVRQPSLHPDLEDARYPLGVGQLARLAGATERQIRHWSDLRLLRSERHDGDRRFWPAAAAAALVLADAPQHTKAVAAEVARGEGARALALVGEALLVWAEDLDSDRRARVTQAARALVELAEPAVSLQPTSDDSDEARHGSFRGAAGRSSSTTRTEGDPAGRRGTREQQAAMLIKERPGITMSELAEAMKVSPNYLYRILPRVEQAGITADDEPDHAGGITPRTRLPSG
jgi:hypothetical protein